MKHESVEYFLFVLYSINCSQHHPQYIMSTANVCSNVVQGSVKITQINTCTHGRQYIHANYKLKK